MIQPGDIREWDIDRAKEFIRKPLSEGFRAWTTLRDRDQVTMTIQELGHLMAWYAAIQLEQAAGRIVTTPALEGGQKSLPEEASHG